MSLKNPIRYPVKYYSHLDDDAPQLEDADGVIKTILKACLVTGYGDKDSAGWEMPFEDEYRMVLRRPLRTGNPPDIKIENGFINDKVSHRIVSYEMDSCTGLDDKNELASVKLLARDNRHGDEWHLIVTDFAFLLCYQFGEFGQSGYKNAALYLGAAQKINNSDNEYSVVSQIPLVADGKGQLWLSGFTTKKYGVCNLHNNELYEAQVLNLDIDETINNVYLAQKIIMDKYIIMPFLCALTHKYNNDLMVKVNINKREMLRVLNSGVQKSVIYPPRVLYIPLDYWEL